HIYTQRGSYSVLLKATNILGCPSTRYINDYITISQPLTEFSANDTIICRNDAVQFSTQAGFDYLWNFGDSQTSAAQNPMHIYADTGFFSVTLQTTDSLACDSALTKTGYIHVQYPPVANFTSDTTYADCYPLLVHFTDLTQHDYLSAWKWNFGDGTSSVFQNPAHNYLNPGLYDVSLIVYTSGGCSDTIVKQDMLEINGPTAGVLISPDTICNSDTAMFVIVNPFGVGMILWDYGDGVWDTVETDTVYHVLSQGGMLHPNVSFSDSTGQCWIFKEDSIYIHKIKANFITSDTSYCIGYNIGFFNTSTGSSQWHWNFGDGAESDFVSPVHFYLTPADYDVSLISSIPFGCPDTIVRTLHIFNRPVTQITQDTSICWGDSLPLSASGADFYAWSPCSWLNQCFISNPTAIPLSTITYHVTYTETSFTCDIEDSVNIEVRPLPVVTLQNDTSICFEDTIEIFAQQGFEQYLWSTGDTIYSVEVFSDTSLWVTVKGNNNCWSIADSINIGIFQLPVVNLGNDTMLCFEDTLIADAGAGYTEYLWFNGATTQTLPAWQADSIFVRVTDTNTCRNTSDTLVLSIISLPVVTLRNDTILCTGDSLVIHAGLEFYGYLWSTGDTTEAITVDYADTIDVVVQNEQGCRSYPDSVVIGLYALSVTDIGNDTAICSGDTISYSAGQGFISYLWYNNNTTETITISPDTTEFIWVYVQDTNTCYSLNDSVLLKINALPVVMLGSDTSICYEDTLIVDAGPGYINYFWYDYSSSQTILATEADSIFVMVTDTNSCQNISDTLILSIIPLPVVTLRNDTMLCTGDSLVIHAGLEFYGYKWSTGDTTEAITVDYADTIDVVVQNEQGCRSYADSVIIGLYALPVIDIGNDTAICFGDTISFSAGQGFISYLWYNDDTTGTITVSPDTSEYIWVYVRDTNTCFSDIDSLYLLIDTLPLVSLGSDTGICFGDTIIIDAGAGYDSYWWWNGATAQSVNIYYSDTIISKVQNSFGCWSPPDTIIVFVNNLPVIYIGNDTNICYSDSVTFTITDMFAEYHWSTGDSASTITVYPSETGIFYGWVLDSNSCKSLNDTANIVVYQLPEITLGNDTGFCEHDSIIFSAGEGFEAYLWSTGDTSATLTVTDSGMIAVHVLSGDGCWSHWDTVNISIYSLPWITLGNDTAICFGTVLELCPGTGFNEWYLSDGSTDTIYNVTEADTVSVT
ncbi:MAG: PKD domain-containing protein, partial [Bacteroidia bacterium]|nr:PKD domain-containing protein [Bacteroidia bacterium]